MPGNPPEFPDLDAAELFGADQVIGLIADDVRVLMVVWDACPQLPVRADASSEAEDGRGLLLVEAVSDDWGWYCRDDTSGKFVWALI
jgi:hypothetical protein